ncbi:hypothetical protein [Williamsoniiplasma luminosum]|uniref:Lipoprotein n=1 Tax=Williamsoniiplasma luminosum TaxID=214888 RepID=A0A2S0NKF0_9MOLU|nr:hypothetical protein [Williamsoniiplasma luminosum]AVP49489.1 MAG: hypothetical protein C5T88_02840 [Williamsoniiplasma luminosum]
MKKILSILGIFTLATTTCVSVISCENFKVIENQIEQKATDPNTETQNLYALKNTESVDPTYPTMSKDVSWQTPEAGREAYGTSITDTKEDYWYFDFSSFAKSKQDLLNNYKSITLRGSSKIFMNHLPPSESWSTNFTKEFGLENISGSDYLTVYEYWRSESPHVGNSNGNNHIRSYIKLSWYEENYIRIDAKALAHAQGNILTYYYTKNQVNISGIDINSKIIDWNLSNSKFVNKMRSNIDISTSTSRFLNSDLNKTISVNGGEEISNKQKIKDAVKSRIDASFTIMELPTNTTLEAEWRRRIDFDNPTIEYPEAKTGVAQNKIKIIFKDFLFDEHSNKFTHEFEIPITLMFDEEGLKNKMANAFSEPFVFSSDTSSDINSEKDVAFGGRVESNKSRIEKEIKLRLRNVFPTGIQKEYIKYNSIYDSKNQTVKIVFKGSTDEDLINQGQLIEFVVLKVVIKLSNKYYAQTTIERMEVEPTKIVDSSSSENKLKDDVPSFELNGHVFTYHNSVTLRFAANEDGSEILKVGGFEVPVLNHIYQIELKDLREFTTDVNAEPSIYNIEVLKKERKNGKIVLIPTLNILIKIDGITASLDGEWVGWKPNKHPSKPEYYQQWLMTEPYIMVDGKREPNPKYRPDLNPITGTIPTRVFIKDPNKKYIFASDPLDNEGMLINDTNSNLDKRQYGYIAEAAVATSGIKHEELEETLKNGTISKIERVELNPQTMEEIGSRKEIPKSEAEFSKEGLYHYIIYQNNNVINDGGVSIQGIYANDISPSEGSTIHKLFFIRADPKDQFKSFMDMKEIKENGLVSLFEDTTQFRHLKDFLFHKGVTAQELSNLNYEQTISVWYQYITKTVRNQNAAPTIKYKNLKDLGSLDTLKVNQTEVSGLLNDLRSHVKTILSKIEANKKEPLQEGLDYVITNSLSSNTMISNLKLEELIVNVQNPHKDTTIYIKALATSLTIEGQNEFKLINDFSFPKNNNEWLDLNKVTFIDYEKNFSNYDINSIKRWIAEEVSRQIKDSAGAITGYGYKDDYVITLNNTNVDIMDDIQNIEKFLNNNLNTMKINVKSVDTSKKIKGSNSFTLKNNFSYPLAPERKTDISKLFWKTDLGKLEDSNDNDVIDKEEIWDKLLQVNKIDLNVYDNLKSSLFLMKVTQLTNIEFKVAMTAKDNPSYEGSVSLRYESEKNVDAKLKKVDIAELFTKNNLGTIEDINTNGVIDKKEIWDKLLDVNKIDLKVWDDLKIEMFNFEITTSQLNYYFLKTTVKENERYYGESNSKFYSEYPIGFEDKGKDKSIISKKDLAWIIPLIFCLIGLGIGYYFLNKHRKKNSNKGIIKQKNENVKYIPDMFQILDLGKIKANDEGIVDNFQLWNSLLSANKMEIDELNIHDFKMRYSKKTFNAILESTNINKYNGSVEIAFSTNWGNKIKIKKGKVVLNKNTKGKK